MPKGGGGGGGKGKNNPPTSAGRMYRINYNSPQAAGLQFLFAPALNYGRRPHADQNPSGFLESTRLKPTYWWDESDISWFIQPEIGPMLDLAGAGATFIYLSTQSYYRIHQEGTVGGWVYPKTVTGIRMFMNKALNNLTANQSWVIGLDAASQPYWTTYSGGTAYQLSSGTAITANRLYHIMGTISRGTMRIYVNGIEKNSVEGPGSDLNWNAGDLALGYQIGIGRYWDGGVGDLRIYNRALSADEIRNLYNPSTRWDLYNIAVYGSSGPGDLPLPPTPPPAGGGSAGKDKQTQRTGQPFLRF